MAKTQKTENPKSQNDVQNVKWYFISPSGEQLHSREYPADRRPIGAIWVSMNNAGELCYRTSTVKSLFTSDLKAVSAPDGYTLTRKDGTTATYRLLGTTQPLTANDPAVVKFIAEHAAAPQAAAEPQPEPKAEKTVAKSNNAKKAENKKSGKARK